MRWVWEFRDNKVVYLSRLGAWLEVEQVHYRLDRLSARSGP